MKVKLSRKPNLDQIVHVHPFVFVAVSGFKGKKIEMDYIPLKYVDGENYLAIKDLIISENQRKRGK